MEKVMEKLTLQKFEEAAEKVKEVTLQTNLVYSEYFSAQSGNKVYLKPENMQYTGAYKVRGAYYKISTMSEEDRQKGLITASAGNHAQGVAYAAHKFGIPATIVMPESAPIAKIQATEGYGAKVILHGSCYDDAYEMACTVCETEGSTFLHPYNDLDVIAGQGTLGLEILGDLPTADVVIVPAGGGGLLAGIAACIKQINPRVNVIGVQAEGADAIAQSFREKKYICTDSVSTIADGIAVKSPGDITVELINRYADDVVTVNDNEISEAILLLMERCKQIVEPSGATPVAAVLKGKVNVRGKKVACLLSGGNIDVSFIQRIIAQGLVVRNRRLRFTVTLLDKPGSLVKLLNDIAAQGANILTVEHDRLSAGLNPNQTNVHIACEVGGKEHGERLLRALGGKGFIVRLNN